MKLFLLVFFFYAQSVLANSFTTTIYSIDYGKKREADIVKFENGKVGFLDLASEEMKQSLKISWQKNLNIEVTLDKNLNILSVQSINLNTEYDLWEQLSSFANYRPSVLPDTPTALNVLNRMRRDYNPEGQCFSRAHIWSYEEFKRSKLRSMKLFMFFTNRYIRNYRFHWWFHVTPMVYVGKIKKTLDRRYTSNPLQTKTWTDVFIKSKRTCPLIKKFDDYANNQEGQDCFLISASMYYFIPRDIEKRDLTGIEKESFVQKEIDRAYRDGFNQ